MTEYEATAAERSSQAQQVRSARDVRQTVKTGSSLVGHRYAILLWPLHTHALACFVLVLLDLENVNKCCTPYNYSLLR